MYQDACGFHEFALLLSGPINKLVMRTGAEVRIIGHVSRMLIGTRSVGHGNIDHMSIHRL